MTKIYGYGEDSLTYLALKNMTLKENKQNILTAIGDDANNADKCLIFYRPSFGRGGRSKAAKYMLGEFDAILATPKAIYLIESKWDFNCNGGKIGLEPRQIVRHIIYQWYYDNLIKCGLPRHDGLQWDEFRNTNKIIFENNLKDEYTIIQGGDCTKAVKEEFIRCFNKEIPTRGHTITENLWSVTKELYEYGREHIEGSTCKLCNILLLFRVNKKNRDASYSLNSLTAKYFEKKELEMYEYNFKNNFFEMECL